MYVMTSEPYPNLTVETAEKLLADAKDEVDLANIYAAANNKAFWVEDEIYDFEEGTQEYTAACEKTDQWFSLYDKVLARIFDILKGEGVRIPDKGYHEILIPFMQRNGYIDGGGWWIAEEETD